MKKGILLALFIAASMHVIVGADESPQPGPNNNVVSGIVVDPNDPAAKVKSDILLQRQNEAVIVASTRNPDHLLAAANDYRPVDFAGDAGIGETNQSFIARLIAKLFRRPSSRLRIPSEAAASEAWIGIYRSCDRGHTWIGSLLPGSPDDSSPASMASPLKGLSAASDAGLASAEEGRVYVAGLAFNRGGMSRIFVARYRDRNDREGGACFNYEFTSVVASGTPTATGQFTDKPWIAADIPRAGAQFGRVYLAYTEFNGLSRGRVRTKLVVAHSADGGVNWKRVVPKINAAFLTTSTGAAIAIDPTTGAVYVAWRVIGAGHPQLGDHFVMIVKSTDGGQTFGPPIPVVDSEIKAFDQFTTESPDYAFRTFGFPTIAVADSGRIFVAWQERVDTDPSSPTFRQPLDGGSPRIVLTRSSNGVFWTSRKAVDAAPITEDEFQPGVGPLIMKTSRPQVQPSLSFSGGRLMLLYYEAHGELSGPSPGFITGIDRRMDVRVAEINMQNGELAAPSVQVSQYDVDSNAFPPAIVSQPSGSTDLPRVNRPNLPMFKGGTVPFIGDYIFLAPALPFVRGSGWKWPISPDDAPGASFHGIFTDSRAVDFPKTPPEPDINGRWDLYSPPGTGAVSCINPGSRNQNIYHSEISDGMVAGSPGTFKRLLNEFGEPIQRTFVFYVENRTDDADPNDPDLDPLRVQASILDDDGVGPGNPANDSTVDASFRQCVTGLPCPPDTETTERKDYEILPRSRVTDTVFVEVPPDGDPTASVRIEIQEIDSSGNLVPGGRTARVTFNPDPTNPQLSNPTPDVPDVVDETITNSETHNPDVSTTPIGAPQLGNPQLGNADPANPQLGNPQLGNPQLGNSALTTAITWEVTNVGNTTSGYGAFTNVPNADALLSSANYQFQLVITRTVLAPATNANCDPIVTAQSQVISNIAITQTSSPQLGNPQLGNPQLGNPQLGNPQLGNPQLGNGTFFVAPAASVEGQNSHGGEGTPQDDDHGTVFPDKVLITLFAHQIAGPVPGDFNPNTVSLAVVAQANNNIQGVIADEAAQDSAAADLVTALDPMTPAVSPSTVVVDGDTVTVAGGTVTNIGDTAAPPFNIGYTLANTAVFTEVTLLTVPDAGNDGLPKLGPGNSEMFTAQSVTIPDGTTPTGMGFSYSLLVVADHGDAVAEVDNANNIVAAPLTVVPPPMITTASSLPDATFDSSYSTTFSGFSGAGGIPPYSWSVVAGSLPPGLSLNPSGLLSGTPTSVGTFSFTVQLTDAAAAMQPANVLSHIDTETFTLKVNLPPGSQLVFEVQPSTTQAGKRLNAAPKVQARYEKTMGNFVSIPGVPVTIAIASDFNPASATLFGTTSGTTGSDGTVTFSNVWIDKLGTPPPGSAAVGTGYKLSASSSDLTSATSDAFNITKKAILIYGPSFVDTVHPSGAPHEPNEKTLAQAAGYVVTVESASNWAALSQSAFAGYNAIVIPDPNFDNFCCDTVAEANTLLSTANANRTLWSNAAAAGPTIVHATDPIFHVLFGSNSAGASKLISNSINFAAGEPDTGLFVSLSYYYHTTTDATTVTLLDKLGTFQVKGLDSNIVKITQGTHPAMAGLTDSTSDCSAPGSCAFHLANWNQSVHSYFTSPLGTWKALAVENSDTMNFPNGRPYIISSK